MNVGESVDGCRSVLMICADQCRLCRRLQISVECVDVCKSVSIV
jgi:hypothetical protein